MGSLNKVLLIGNLGRDPEVRYTAAGAAFCNFSIATTETWKDKSGNKQEKTEWHRIVAWGKLAEICGEYLGKGKPVYIEGSIQTREWEDRDGNKRTTTEIKAWKMIMLGSPGSGRDSSPDSSRGATPDDANDVFNDQDKDAPPPPDYGPEDDVPF